MQRSPKSRVVYNAHDGTDSELYIDVDLPEIGSNCDERKARIPAVRPPKVAGLAGMVASTPPAHVRPVEASKQAPRVRPVNTSTTTTNSKQVQGDSCGQPSRRMGI